jgi:hypothetical protein
MKKSMAILCAMVLVLAVVGIAGATPEVIGTASYLGGTYNLIYEEDNNGQDLIWLDYTHRGPTGYANWQDQMDWATGLNASGVLTYNLNPGISVTWGSEWRLPATVDGLSAGPGGYDGTTTAGWNITTSEMGHLYYASLGNKGYYATDGTNPQPGWGLTNTGPFTDLQPYIYRSGTEYSFAWMTAWLFDMRTSPFCGGHQWTGLEETRYYALAVRPGDVSPVPEPATMLLLASGLVGLAGLRKKAKK